MFDWIIVVREQTKIKQERELILWPWRAQAEYTLLVPLKAAATEFLGGLCCWTKSDNL